MAATSTQTETGSQFRGPLPVPQPPPLHSPVGPATAGEHGSTSDKQPATPPRPAKLLAFDVTALRLGAAPYVIAAVSGSGLAAGAAGYGLIIQGALCPLQFFFISQLGFIIAGIYIFVLQRAMFHDSARYMTPFPFLVC